MGLNASPPPAETVVIGNRRILPSLIGISGVESGTGNGSGDFFPDMLSFASQKPATKALDAGDGDLSEQKP